MDWSTIEEHLAQAASQSYDDFVVNNSIDDIYALCLSVAEDGMGIGMNANSETYFSEKLSAESDVEDTTPQYKNYLRWSPAEWRFEGIGDDVFQPINDTLTKMVLNDELDHSRFIKLINAMIGALRNLRELQDGALKEVTMFVTITDSDEAEEIENRSAISINPPDLAQAFVSRFG